MGWKPEPIRPLRDVSITRRAVQNFCFVAELGKKEEKEEGEDGILLIVIFGIIPPVKPSPTLSLFLSFAPLIIQQRERERGREGERLI